MELSVFGGMLGLVSFAYKINVLFPVTCWGKRGSNGRKNIL